MESASGVKLSLVHIKCKLSAIKAKEKFLTAKEAVQQSIRSICLFVCLSQP